MVRVNAVQVTMALDNMSIRVVFLVTSYDLFSVVRYVAQTVVRIQETSARSSQRVYQDPRIWWLFGDKKNERNWSSTKYCGSECLSADVMHFEAYNQIAQYVQPAYIGSCS